MRKCVLAHLVHPESVLLEHYGVRENRTLAESREALLRTHNRLLGSVLVHSALHSFLGVEIPLSDWPPTTVSCRSRRLRSQAPK